MMIVMISFVTQAEFFLKGETNCKLGEYNIVHSSDSYVLNGDELNTYINSHKNSSKTVKISVLKEKDRCRYIVVSEDLSVQYICKKDYFGGYMHDKDFNKLGLETDKEMLELGGYYHQKITTPNSIGLKNYLG